MKKNIISFIIVLLLFVAMPVSAERIGDVPELTDHDKVTIHLFYASWCHNCHNFLTYMKDKYEDYTDYFEIKTYLVSSDSNGQRISIPENAEIMDRVAEFYGTDAAFPLIIIGKDFFQLGYPETAGPLIIEKALEEYQNEDYEDTVAKLIKENNYSTSKIEGYYEACTQSGIDCGKTDNTAAYILVGVFVVLLGGLTALVIAGKKK